MTMRKGKDLNYYNMKFTSMRIPIRKFICAIALIIITLLFASLNKQTPLVELSKWSTYSLILALLLLWFGKRRLTGGILYYLCLSFMHCGQVYIIAFGMEFSQTRKSNISLGTSLPLSQEAVYFTTICCLIAAIIICMFENNEKVNISKNESEFKNIRLTSLGWLAVSAICILTIISDLVRIRQVATLGYGLGYRQTNTLLYYADLLFPLAMFLVISIYKNDWKTLSKVLAFVIIRSGIVAFLVGSRSNAVLDILLSSFAIVKLTNNQNIRKNTFRIVGIIFLTGIIILPFTGLLRNVGSLTLGEFLKTNNPISYSLTEFGGTIINVRLGIEYKHSLSLGTYFSSFLSIIPLSSMFFSSVISTYGGSYSTYLNTVHGGGLGGSIIGEAAFWFGNGIFG